MPQPHRISRITLWAVAMVILALVAALWGWRSYSRPATASAAPALAPPTSGVRLEAMQAASLGIKTESAASTDTVALTQLPAEAMPPLAASTQVTVPYAGIVIRILADEGQRVRRGQPLLRLQSRDLLVAQADVQRARSQAAVADQQARRDVLLADEGIIRLPAGNKAWPAPPSPGPAACRPKECFHNCGSSVADRLASTTCLPPRTGWYCGAAHLRARPWKPWHRPT